MNPVPPQASTPLTGEALELLRYAEACLGRGEFSQAERFLEHGLLIAPDQPDLLHRKAVALHMQDRFVEAAATFNRVLEHRPGDAALYNNLGSALGAAGDMPAAVSALRHACELMPGRANYWYNLAKALEGVSDTAGACEALTRFLELKPDDAEARILRADAFKTMGRLKDAEADLRHVLARHPDSVEAWTPLVNLKSAQLSGSDLEQIGRVHADPRIREDYRTSLGFAYGQALETKQRYDEAFAVLMAANAAKRRQLQWDPARTSRFVDDIMWAFSKPDAPVDDVRRGSSVIMLFGMPRSGSTLIEQMLSAHPLVEGGGEISDLGQVLYEESIRRGMDIPQWAAFATPADWARLGEEYLERTKLWCREKSIFTDKELGKWQFVGAARAMLPGARFIHCRRDPVETCWSCFKHEFRADQLYSYDFRELAAYWRDYDRLVDFWHARYPGLICDYVYEDLVSNPEVEIRRVLDHCGLPFDPACLRFHEVQRSVRTASAGQVRQPLNANTAVAWRYRTLLNSLRTELGLPAVPA